MTLQRPGQSGFKNGGFMRTAASRTQYGVGYYVGETAKITAATSIGIVAGLITGVAGLVIGGIVHIPLGGKGSELDQVKRVVVPITGGVLCGIGGGFVAGKEMYKLLTDIFG
jgi:hypothetical protein